MYDVLEEADLHQKIACVDELFRREILDEACVGEETLFICRRTEAVAQE